VNRIDELSGSRGDLENLVSGPMTRNIFFANFNTPKNSTDSYIYFKLAKNFITLVTLGKFTLKKDQGFFKSNSPTLNEYLLLKEAPKALEETLEQLRAESLLSLQIIKGFFPIICVAPKVYKFEIMQSLRSLIRSSNGTGVIEKLMPLFRESFKFCAYSNYAKSVAETEMTQSKTSIINSPLAGDKKCLQMYKSIKEKVFVELIKGSEYSLGLRLRWSRCNPEKQLGNTAYNFIEFKLSNQYEGQINN
jgi:hypothetical protein